MEIKRGDKDRYRDERERDRKRREIGEGSNVVDVIMTTSPVERRLVYKRRRCRGKRTYTSMHQRLASNGYSLHAVFDAAEK